MPPPKRARGFGKVQDRPRAKAPRPPTSQGRGGRYQGPGSPRMREEFEGTLAAERREAEAKAARAEARRDEAPATRGPRAAPRGPKAPKLNAKGLSQALRAFASRNPRRVLLAELLLVVVVTITSKVADGEVPRPSDLLAPFVVYLVLAFAAEVGGDTAKLAAAFGGLVALAVVITNAGAIGRTITVATTGGLPTTPGAQGVSGFTEQGAGAGYGTAGGGGGGSW